MKENNQHIIGVIQKLSIIADENAETTEEVTDSVHRQVSSIQDMSSASENLSKIAVNLQSEVSQFQI